MCISTRATLCLFVNGSRAHNILWAKRLRDNACLTTQHHRGCRLFVFANREELLHIRLEGRRGTRVPKVPSSRRSRRKGTREKEGDLSALNLCTPAAFYNDTRTYREPVFRAVCKTGSFYNRQFPQSQFREIVDLCTILVALPPR